MASDFEPHDQPDGSGPPHDQPHDQASGAPDAPPTIPTPPVAPTTPVPPVPDGPAPGWYPDPWLGGHYRYWNGTSWTGDSYRGPDPSPPPVPPLYGAYLASDAPNAAASGTTTQSWGTTWDAPPVPSPPPPFATGTGLPPTPPGERPRMSRGRFAIVLALVALLVGSGSFVGAYLYHSRSETTNAASSPNPLTPSNPVTPPTPSTTAPPADPSSSSLARIVVTQGDVGSSMVVQTISQGQSLGQPTLDLCNGTYPSESLRTARLQVAAADDQGNTVLSTEAVLYKDAAATQQAFTELTSVASKCPSTPVPSPVGEPTVTTRFNAAPDGSWPQVDGVQRLAFDFVSTDDTGQVNHSVAVYLKRGRALLGVYFQQPDNPPTVAGQSTIAGIVNVLATRLGQLSASSVGA